MATTILGCMNWSNAMFVAMHNYFNILQFLDKTLIYSNLLSFICFATRTFTIPLILNQVLSLFSYYVIKYCKTGTTLTSIIVTGEGKLSLTSQPLISSVIGRLRSPWNRPDQSWVIVMGTGAPCKYPNMATSPTTWHASRILLTGFLKVKSHDTKVAQRDLEVKFFWQ